MHLKELQRKLLQEFLYLFKPHDAAVGFIIGCSVKEGALRHLGSKVVLCMDLSDFFGSIKTNRVYKLVSFLINRLSERYTHFTFTQQDIVNIAELLTFKGKLPQGAPTSPAVANLTALNLDKKLESYANEHDLIYTRYL